MPKLTLKDIDDRLGKLEDKMKSGFLEAEKRLASFESLKPGVFEERVKEVEDLQMLTQLEIMKLKEKEQVPVAIAKIPAGLEEKTNDLLHRLSALESEKITEKGASYYISKIVKEKKEIESEFSRMRSLKKDLETILREKDEISKKISDSELNLEKVDTLYSKMKTIDEKISVEVDKMHNMMRSIDERVNETVEKSNSMRKTVESRVAVAEEKFKQRSDRLEALRDSLNTKLLLVDDKINELDSFRKTIGDVNAFKANVDDESIQRITLEKNLQDLKNQVDEVTDKFNQLDIDKKLEDEFVTIATLEKKLQDFTKKFDMLNSRMSGVSSSINAVVDSKMKAVETKLKEVPEIKQMKDLYAKMDMIEAKLETEKEFMDYGDAVNSLKKKLVSLETTLKKAEHQDFSKLQSRLSELEKSLTSSEKIDHANIIKEIADIEKSLKMAEGDVLSTINSEIEAIKAAQNDMKDKIEKEILGKEDILDAARQKFDQEVEEKITQFSSKIDELRMKMQLEKEQITKSLNMDKLMQIRNEIITQKRQIHDIERNLEISAIRFFTENLEEFSKEIDKKLPSVVTRDEFEKVMKKVHMPDIPGLDKRIMLLERKIDDVHNMARRFSVHQPIIVE